MNLLKTYYNTVMQFQSHTDRKYIARYYIKQHYTFFTERFTSPEYLEKSTIESYLQMFFLSLAFCLSFRTIFRVNRTFSLQGRPPKALLNTTFSSKRSPSRWWTLGGRGRRGRSGSSVSTASRPYSSWSHRLNMTR